MNMRQIALPRDREACVFEAGSGPPLVYLHGIADLHGAAFEPLPFHEALAERHALIAPAHPGCAETSEDETLETIDDLVFHFLELFDALNLDRFQLVGASIGGWFAAEFAVRHPERVAALALLSPTGLFVPGAPIGDLFWQTHPADGVSLATLRALLFGDAECEAARAMFPDGRGAVEQELLRYKLFRFAARIGFSPPYLHNRRLADRLARFPGPALIVQGGLDRLVPASHGAVYAERLGNARLERIAEAGHSLWVEAPERAAALLAEFLDAS